MPSCPGRDPATGTATTGSLGGVVEVLSAICNWACACQPRLFIVSNHHCHLWTRNGSIGRSRWHSWNREHAGSKTTNDATVDDVVYRPRPRCVVFLHRTVYSSSSARASPPTPYAPHRYRRIPIVGVNAANTLSSSCRYVVSVPGICGRLCVRGPFCSGCPCGLSVVLVGGSTEAEVSPYGVPHPLIYGADVRLSRCIACICALFVCLSVLRLSLGVPPRLVTCRSGVVCVCIWCVGSRD